MHIQRWLRSLVLRKNIAEKCAGVRGWLFRNTASNFALSTLVRLRSFSLSCEKTSPKNVLRFGLSFSRKTAFLAPCGMRIQRRLRSLVLKETYCGEAFCCEKMRGKPEYNLQKKPASSVAESRSEQYAISAIHKKGKSKWITIICRPLRSCRSTSA